MRMENVLFWLWDASYRTAIVIVAVLLIRRLLLRKFPAKYSYYLWFVVALSLVLPVQIASPISLYNVVPNGSEVAKQISTAQSESVAATSDDEQNTTVADRQQVSGNTQTAPNVKRATDTVQCETGELSEMIKAEGNTSKNSVGDHTKSSVGNHAKSSATDNVKSSAGKESDSKTSAGTTAASSVKKTDAKLSVGSSIQAGWKQVTDVLSGKWDFAKWAPYILEVWIIGVVAGLLYMLLGALRTKKYLSRAVSVEDQVYECEGIASPFVFGYLHPAVYIPYHLEEDRRQYIVAHEKYHITRKDYLIKCAAALLTAIYWFHPLVWIAFVMMERDMEMSCDEYVLRDCSREQRAQYSESLLWFAKKNRLNAPGQLAFGAHTTKHRVRNVLTSKNTKKYIGILVAVLAVFVAAGFLTNGKGITPSKEKDQQAAKKDLVTLYIAHSGDFSGEDAGWYGKLLEQRFGVKVVYEVPDPEKINYTDGTYDLFIDMRQDGKFSLFDGLTNDQLAKLSDGSYYYTRNVSQNYHENFAYTWDLRYDLYKECGSPEINTFEDLLDVLVKMKQKSGNDYAMSMMSYNEKDETISMPVSLLLSGYYGYSREGKFMVRGADGKVQDLLTAVHGSEDTNLYQKILKQWNQCYRKGLLDPKSRTKDMDTYEADKKSGKVLCLIDGINRNSEYDTKWKETAQEQPMYPVVPKSAVLAAYSPSTTDGKASWCLGVNRSSKHLKLAQKVAAYLASPLGYMENLHGPEGLCWYYDKDGKPHLTDLGKKTAEDATVELQSKDSKYAMYNGIMFLDGCPANYTPYYASDINPDSGETFDISGWSSEAESRQQEFAAANNKTVLSQWQKDQNAKEITEYLENRGNYTIYPDLDVDFGETKEYPSCLRKVCKVIQDGTWNAIFAKDDQEFESCIQKMYREVKQAGYDKCVAYEKEKLD